MSSTRESEGSMEQSGNESSKISHTPGPWEVDDSAPGEGPYVTTNGHLTICQICHHGLRSAEANAKFIAAAPDTFKALQTLLSIIDNEADLAFSWPADFRERSNAYKKAKDAIAKAIG